MCILPSTLVLYWRDETGFQPASDMILIYYAKARRWTRTRILSIGTMKGCCRSMGRHWRDGEEDGSHEQTRHGRLVKQSADPMDVCGSELEKHGEAELHCEHVGKETCPVCQPNNEVDDAGPRRSEAKRGKAKRRYIYRQINRH